ncbi:Cytochrome [Forsythia ovata]|uniref:Cytochrome n=1 Tax=Forsythia ovata TaxID=205694 RepID=A0ABD1X2E0_9LAMI
MVRGKGVAAEFFGGVMQIFATIVLPDKGKSMVNHVWQVGPSVTSRVPVKHEFQPTNLNSKGSLNLLKGRGTASTNWGSRTKKKNHASTNAIKSVISCEPIQVMEGVERILPWEDQNQLFQWHLVIIS